MPARMIAGERAAAEGQPAVAEKLLEAGARIETGTTSVTTASRLESFWLE